MIPMSFMKQSADLQPIEDTVFAVVSMAKQDIAEHGAEAVVDATIGSLYDEQGRLVAYQNVFDHYNAIAKEVKAAYAASFTGNPGYRTQVRNWVLQDQPIKLNASVIATPGGTGAVNMTMINVLEAGQTVVLPEICWGSYNLMAAQARLTQAEESPVEERELRRIEPQEEKPAGDETPSGEERPAGEESPAGEETRPEGEGEPS